MSIPGKLPAALAAILSTAVLAGCSQTGGLDSSFGVKSAVAKVMPSGTMSATRGKRYRASERERQCLARAMFFESNRSSQDGLVAVGSVVMNRLDSGKWGNDICGVVGAKRQFAPGVLSRQMNSKALPDVMAAADSVLQGQRHPKVHKDVMFFHTAGLKFPYKNMHYTVVAGGNSFYEKRSRRRPMRLDPPVEAEVMVASAEQPLPGVADGASLVQSPVQTALVSPVQPSRKQSMSSGDRDAGTIMTAAALPRQSAPVKLRRTGPATGVAMAAPATDRFGGKVPPPLTGTATPTDVAGMETGFDTAEPSMAFEASPDQATEIGELLMMQQGQ